MYKRELVGIPYIGNNDLNKINNTDENEVETIEIESLLEIVSRYANRQYIVIIDKKNGYYSFLRDICFDYVSGQVFIPYLTYDLKEIHNFRGKRDRHLLVVDGEVNIRYNFDIEKYLVFSKDLHREIEVFDTKSKKILRLKWGRLGSLGDSTFSVHDLYSKYLNCIAYVENEGLAGHVGGYNYITKEAEKFKNIENRIRQRKGIPTYKDGKNAFYDKQNKLLGYRDVRNITYTNMKTLLKDCSDKIKLASLLRKGDNIKYVINDDINYIDRLRIFETRLFDIVYNRLNPIEPEYKDLWHKLNGQDRIIKVGDLEYKLIFKWYWMDKPVNSKMKTIYHRIGLGTKHEES